MWFSVHSNTQFHGVNLTFRRGKQELKAQTLLNFKPLFAKCSRGMSLIMWTEGMF